MKAGAPQSRWARFFLTQPALSVRQRIFKGLFYFFFVFAMLGVLLALSTQFSEGPNKEEAFIIFFFSTAFYLGIALLFRRAAR